MFTTLEELFAKNPMQVLLVLQANDLEERRVVEHHLVLKGILIALSFDRVHEALKARVKLMLCSIHVA